MKLETLKRAKELEIQYEALKRDKQKWERNFYKRESRRKPAEFYFPGDIPKEILEAFRLAVIASFDAKIAEIIKEFTGL